MKITAVEFYAENAMKLEIERLKGQISTEQMLNKLSTLLIESKEIEKAVISKAYYDGLMNGHRKNTIPIYETEQEEIKRFGNEYYNDKYTSNEI